jgi:signal peptidase
MIVHRVIEVINNDGDPAFVTKGDANAIKDTLVVDQTNFLGKVTGISSFLGKIAKFLTSTSSFFFFLVIVICVYVIFTQIRKILKIRKEQIHEAEVNKIKNEIVNQEKGVEYEKNHHHHCDHS